MRLCGWWTEATGWERRRARRLREPPAWDGSVSAITCWEIALLVEKGRLRLARDVTTWLDGALSLPGVRLMAIDPPIAVASVRLPGNFHSDPADRLIVATARHYGVPLVTADRAILAYAQEGHVRAVDAGR